MKIAILGAGAWGTALAINLSAKHTVHLWARDPVQVAQMQSTRCNQRYLPAYPLPAGVMVMADLAATLDACDYIVLAVTVAGLRQTLGALQTLEVTQPVIWLCKGFERPDARLPHEVFRAMLPDALGAVLSGPSFAQEVAAGLPTALTVASDVSGLAARLGQVLHGPSLRVYSSDDVIGVEVGGAVKNVMAIAAGISDGLGLGLNARAALITRGLAEMTRLGIALGGRAETFGGLSGMGDLLLTATGDLSRNRQIGLALARGVVTSAAQASLGHVAEGVFTASEVWRRAQALGVEMPITAAVCELLEHPNHAAIVVQSLLARDARAE